MSGGRERYMGPLPMDRMRDGDDRKQYLPLTSLRCIYTRAKAIFFLIFDTAAVTAEETRRLETMQQVGSEIAFVFAFGLI